MNNQTRYTFHLLWPFFFSMASCFAQDKEDERIQQVVYESLVHYHYCKSVGCEDNKPYPNDIPTIRKWYNEVSKNELLKLLENKWPEEEKQELAELSVRKYLETEIRNLTKSRENPELLPKYKKSMQKRLDSLVKITQIKADTFPPFQQAIKKRKKELDDLKLDDRLIRMAGLLDDPRYIPVLRQAMGDSIHFNQQELKIALARFKVEPYHSDMIKFYSIDTKVINKKKINHRELNRYYNSKRSVLLYISTQESIWELSKFLPVELKVTDSRTLNSDDVGYSPVSRRAFEDIAGRLDNKVIKDYVSANSNELNVNPIKFRVLQETPINKKHITFLQKWLQENYGRYELVRD